MAGGEAGVVGVLNLSIFLHNFHAACILSMDILTSETHFPLKKTSLFFSVRIILGT